VSSRGGDPRWVAFSPVALINGGQAVRWTSVLESFCGVLSRWRPRLVAVSPVALVNGGQALRWTSVLERVCGASRGGDPRWVAFSPLLPPSGGDASDVWRSGLVFEALPCRRGPNVGSRSHCCGAAGWAIDTGWATCGLAAARPVGSCSHQCRGSRSHRCEARRGDRGQTIGWSPSARGEGTGELMARGGGDPRWVAVSPVALTNGGQAVR
jgi:hypothetical protein